MQRHLRRALAWALLPSILTFGSPMWAGAAEIPSDLDRSAPAAKEVLRERAGSTFHRAGFPALEAVSRASALDGAELAHAGRTDLRQQGGDVVVTIALVAAIVIVTVVLVQYIQEKDAKL